MERRYRETTLKRKKLYVKALAGTLFVVILWQCVFGAARTILQEAVMLGTNCMQPAVIKYEQSKEKDEDTPFLLWLFVPTILTYTWQKELPAFTVIDIKKTEPESEQVTERVFLEVSKEQELSLIQENLYLEGGEIFKEANVTGLLIGEINTVLETDNRTMLKKYDLEKYSNTTALIKDFYVVDASTSADADLLDIHTLTSYDCTLDKNAPGPQILIYHSHSQEGFIDSVEGDAGTTIVGAGEKLTRLLEEVYGYDVLHHDGVYDIPSRDNAYSNALPDVERVLEENPTIQVVIDLHRDAVAEGTKLVTTIDGKDYARFMFFNGICRSTNGPISYLNNPYLQDNLAFSFQAQVIAESYFPGISRKIYLKAWRYNMHLKPRNMLIELGAQTNTVEEIMNTTEVLAFVINKVLSGQ